MVLCVIKLKEFTQFYKKNYSRNRWRPESKNTKYCKGIRRLTFFDLLISGITRNLVPGHIYEDCTTVLCVAAWATRVALLRVNRLSCFKRLGQ